eukprot:TRINITY_DN972_c0_g1_i1.p1 TRINITY_DN972_c0_g1~~TRINITY_DN972_c0_g1_i1.p1  ORF type:complete len:367 (+),score=62.35 TRINITY_DN972_c0_g1_i1:28-1101(+)
MRASSAVLTILLIGVIAVAAAMPAKPLFHPKDETTRRSMFGDWTRMYNKVYDTVEEHERRFGVFASNLDLIDKLNAQNSRAVFAINKFADLTQSEFKGQYCTTRVVPQEQTGIGYAPLFSQEQIQALPKSADWRSKGAVTPVKNQGQCGSCWAFSTTGNVEGQWFLANHTDKNGKIVSLSEQNLVDCDHQCTTYDNQQSCDSGCDGGLQPNAYTYIIKNNGIDTESSYPYEGVDDTCRYNAANKGAMISNWTFVSKDENQMAAYLVAHGPLAIAADAAEWQFYVWGVFDAPCGTQLDHGILIVGYGTEVDEFGFSIDYWIVKNSWGDDWGLAGYLWIQRGVGECGLNTYVTSSIINK